MKRFIVLLAALAVSATFTLTSTAGPRGGSSGVIVEVVVNGRSEHARIWVEKSDKTLSFSPY